LSQRRVWGLISHRLSARTTTPPCRQLVKLSGFRSTSFVRFGLEIPAGTEAVDAPAGHLHQAGAGVVSSSPLLVGFFVRPESRFFVPTRAGVPTPRAAAVEAGCCAVLETRSALGRPRLADGEHGVRLPAVGTSISSAPCAL